ncbi:MAG TPA: hypothetical protein VN841_20970 [Bryobacteraceae bacterium]|nr:hypothetical protein [Bryobacteraceae bacterium]
MRNAFVSCFVAAVALGTVTLLVAQNPAAAPEAGKSGKGGGKGRGPATPTGPAPHLADGTPDLSGLWMGSGSNSGDISKGLKPGEQVSMLPWAEALMKTRKSQDDPEANCLPTGVPRGAPYPWRIVQTPTHYFMLFEGNIHSFRQIFMDSRKHPEDPDPTWYGDSIGHWEKDTLVIDTVGFNDKFWFDYLGHPHTEKLHTIERYTRTDLGNMAIEVTIDDPGAYTKPFTTVGRARLQSGELLEYICQENNIDLVHVNAPAQLP